MAKWVGRIVDGTKNSLWTKWIQIYLIRGQTFWQLKIPLRCSWTWCKILELRPLLIKYFRVKIGNGEHTLLWWDPWLELGPVCVRGDEEYLDFSGLDSKIKLAQC